MSWAWWVVLGSTLYMVTGYLILVHIKYSIKRIHERRKRDQSLKNRHLFEDISGVVCVFAWPGLLGLLAGIVFCCGNHFIDNSAKEIARHLWLRNHKDEQ